MQRTLCSSFKFAANLRNIESRISVLNASIRCMSSEWGSGAGKGGGSGGSIRDAGGAFGKMESAREEQYFRKKQAQQLDEIKQHLHEEIDRHQALIKEHEQAIAKSKKKIEEMTRKQE